MYQERGFGRYADESMDARINNTGKSDGERAEEIALGSLPIRGFEQFFNKKSFEKKIEEIAEKVWENPKIQEILARIYFADTEEIHKQLLKRQIRTTFMQAGFVKKQLEEARKNGTQNDENSPSYFQKILIQEIKENFTIKDAIIQVVNMSEISKKQNLAEYNENISTPFTRALRTKILSNLSKMYSESKWHCEYVSATLENSENKTFLDVFHATDAFALIYDDKGCMMIELIDFTIDPRKTERAMIDARGGVSSRRIQNGKDEYRKYMVYVDSQEKENEARLQKIGQECGGQMLEHIQQKIQEQKEKVESTH